MHPASPASLLEIVFKKKGNSCIFVLLCQMCSVLGNAEDTHFVLLDPNVVKVWEIA